jgi:PilZ domain
VNLPFIGPAPGWMIAIGIGGTVLAIIFLLSLFTRHRWPGHATADRSGEDPSALGTKPEQRSAHRRRGNPVGVYLTDADGKGEPIRAVVINRSAGGLGLEIDQPLEVGLILSVRAIHAPVTVPWVQVQVRGCRQVDETWEVGCQFLKPPPWSVMLLFG